MSRVRVPFPARLAHSLDNWQLPDFFIKAAWPSGLRRRSAKPLFVGSNPTAASHFIILAFNMYIVYILFSEKDKKRYVGCTSNINRRLDEHNSGLVTSTKNRRPLNLIYSEVYDNKIDALEGKLFLKLEKEENT